MRDDERHPDPGVELLIRAGIVLATSLHDPTTTMREVAGLTVPDLGDMCVIDLLDQHGEIKDVGVAAADPSLEDELEELRRRYPLSPDGEHPVARVIRSGQPVLLARMADSELTSFATSSPHAKFMIEHDYRSAVVAPLVARDRTLGAISVLRFGEREPYDRDDLDLVRALAWRAALAIDNARLFSEVRALEQRLEAILTNVAEAITVTDAQGETIFANQAAAKLLGVTVDEQLRSSADSLMGRFVVTDEHGRELALDDLPSRALFRGERPEPLLVRNIVRDSGEERWLLVRCSPLHDPETGEVLYSVNVFENVTEMKRAQLTGHFLAEASRALGSTMDYWLTLKRVARLAVPQIADWCAVDLVGPRGEIERVAVHHVDPDKLALAERMAQEYPVRNEDPRGVARAIREGESILASAIPPEALAAFARDEEHLRLLQRVGMTSAIVVPMVAAGKVIGAITFVTAESQRRLGPDDLELAEELARRAGVAVENARLYTERTRIASTLQRALLPESLPTIPGVELEALYTAAGELNEVGGDFYDVFACGPERWMLVIGDVCGKGPRAAAVTALARYTLRAAAMSGQRPVEMLKMLHRALIEQQSPADMCTVCLVELTPAAEAVGLEVALAGHPPPLTIRAAGKVEQVGEIGTLLGMIEPLAIEPVKAKLAAGDTLLLYTDGVTDAGAEREMIGEAGLRELCVGAEERSLAQLLSRLESVALERSGEGLRDDMALLAVRPAPSPKRAGASSSDAELAPAS
jgi:PAS domain S-box-containing protein